MQRQIATSQPLLSLRGEEIVTDIALLTASLIAAKFLLSATLVVPAAAQALPPDLGVCLVCSAPSDR